MQETPVLTVGAVLGDSDPESMAWSRAIGALSLQVKELRVGVTSSVRVSVAYHVDGRMVPNEFVGVRTGRFDKRAHRLVVQVAVPRLATGDRRALLVGLLKEAVTEAEEYVRSKDLGDGLPEIRGLVGRLSTS